MVPIFFIYADNCEHCQQALSNIESAIIKCKDKTCNIYKFKYDSKEAITLAVKHNIDDLPGIIIGTKVFIKECTEEDILKAINKI